MTIEELFDLVYMSGYSIEIQNDENGGYLIVHEDASGDSVKLSGGNMVEEAVEFIGAAKRFLRLRNKFFKQK